MIKTSYLVASTLNAQVYTGKRITGLRVALFLTATLIIAVACARSPQIEATATLEPTGTPLTLADNGQEISKAEDIVTPSPAATVLPMNEAVTELATPDASGDTAQGSPTETSNPETQSGGEDAGAEAQEGEEATSLEQEFQDLVEGEAFIGGFPSGVDFYIYTGDKESNVVTVVDGSQYAVAIGVSDIDAQHLGQQLSDQAEIERRLHQAISAFIESSEGLIGTDISNPEYPVVTHKPSRVMFHIVLESFSGRDFQIEDTVKYKVGESAVSMGGIATSYVFYDEKDSTTAHVILRTIGSNLSGKKFPSDWQTEEILPIGIKNVIGRFFTYFFYFLVLPPERQLAAINTNLLMTNDYQYSEELLTASMDIQRFLTFQTEQVQ